MIVIPMIIIATRCCTADPITLTHYRLFSNNATYCRLSSPRFAHGRSNYCHSLSIVLEQCDLLPIIVATRCSTADQITVIHCRLLSNNATYCRLWSPRATPRPNKVSLTIDFCRLLSPRAFFLGPFCFSGKQDVRLICLIAAVCYICVALEGQLFLLQPSKHDT